MHDMIQLLQREYEKIFEPALKLNNRLKTAVYEEDSKLTIEDYDQIKEMGKAVVNVGNQYKAIANQVISSFTNRNPDMNFFLGLYKMDSMTHQINSLRSEARVGQIGEDHAVERAVNKLRESYFHAISHAKDAERIFDNFAYQTEIMRTSRDSSAMTPVQRLAALSGLRTMVPMLVRFQGSFDLNMRALMKELNELSQGDVTLFDQANNLETRLHEHADNNRRPWWWRWKIL